MHAPRSRMGPPGVMTMESVPSQCDPMPPDVSPEDVWGDPEWLNGDTAPLPRVLPGKRTIRRRKKDAVASADGPLRIDSWRRPRPAADEPQATGLEIAEINGHVLRLAPEIPEVERVPRQVTFHARAPGSRGKKRPGGETGEWGRPQRHSLLWFFGASTAIITMVVGAMVMLPRVNRANAFQIRPGEMELVIDRIEADEGPQRISAMMQRLDEANSVYDAFAGARAVDEVLPLLRDPATAGPLLRTTGWSGFLPRAGSGHAWTVREDNNLTYGLMEVARTDHSRFHVYFVDVDGGLRIDWKASTGHGTANFAGLAEGRGNPVEIRGWITPVDFYTLAFPENAYRSYRLLSPDEKLAVWVYAKVDGEAAETLEPLFRGGQILVGSKEATKVTLRLAPPPEDAMPNQWLLAELLHKEWIGP